MTNLPVLRTRKPQGEHYFSDGGHVLEFDFGNNCLRLYLKKYILTDNKSSPFVFFS